MFRVILAGIALFIAFNAAIFGLAFYAESRRVGIRERAQLWRSIDWYPPVTLLRPRCHGGNETSAISTLRNISSSQEQFRHAGAVDEDGDGLGEFGTFADLSGGKAPRGRDAVLSPPVLSGAFRTCSLLGEVTRSGYHIRLWLPAKDGSFVSEGRRNVGAGVLDADAAETRWRVYAWPSAYDVSANRTFYIDEARDIWGTEDARYSGAGFGPSPGAATPQPGTLVPETPQACATYTGADGNVWKKIN